MGARLSFLAVAAAALAGCGGGGIVDREVSADRNAFTYRATFDRAAGREDIVWPVSGERAWIRWGETAVTEGEFILIIRDADGTEVYRDRATAGPPGTQQSGRGTPGDWRVEAEFTRLVGFVDVRATAVID